MRIPLLFDPPKGRLATPTRNDISGGVSRYTCREPGDTAISIQGTKVEGGCLGTPLRSPPATGTFPPSPRLSH